MHPPQLQTTKVGFVWRLFSPSGFLLALVVFPLPWLEVRCNAQGDMANPLDPAGPPIRTVVMATQSGLESAYGGHRRGPHVDFYLQDLRNQGYLPSLLARTDVRPAWLMSAYAAVLGMGMLLGLVLPVGIWRLGAVAACAACAVSLLATQTAVEFPLAHHLQELHADPTWGERELAALRHVGPVQYTPFFYLAWGLTLASAAVVAVEWRMIRSLSSVATGLPPPRSPYVYDD